MKSGAPNQAWRLDFVADPLPQGQRYRGLTVIDVYARECLAMEVGPSLKGEDVRATLDRVRQSKGVPKKLFCDNGTEFASRLLDLWAYHHRVQIDFSRPGKPTDHDHIESFNGTFRDECLNTAWFDSMTEAKREIESWRKDYNESRPQEALGNRTPKEFAAAADSWDGCSSNGMPETHNLSGTKLG
jgi:putative transposase